MYLANGLRRAARIRPNHPAVLHSHFTRTWSEVADRVRCLAAGLRGLGVDAGDRVAVLALNGPGYLEAIFAIPWAGAVLVPLNTRLAEAELAYMIDDSASTTLLFDVDHADIALSLRERCPTLEHLVAIYTDGSSGTEASFGQTDVIDVEDLIADNEPMEDRQVEPDDLFAICYTGGTTGRPKGVMLTHGGMQHHVGCLMVDMRWREDTRYLHVTPMFHLADLGPAYCLTMLGGTHAFLPRFQVALLLDTLETFQINAVNLVPTLIGWLVNDPAVASRDLTALRDIGYGSAPISEGILRKALQTFPDVTFRQFYGMTEITASLSVLRPEHHSLEANAVKRLQSAGQPTYSVDVRIVDANDREVAQGEAGEIQCRTPALMKGYWNDEEQTRAAITPDGWMRTGDVGYMDDGGFLFVVDRVKDMIVTGGENVFSNEVENAVSSFPGVAQVAVIGIPSDRWGEAVHAVVIPNGNAEPSAKDIIAHCRTLIAGYKCPKSVSFRHEPLPLSGGGKVQKNILRAPFWKDSTRAVS